MAVPLDLQESVRRLPGLNIIRDPPAEPRNPKPEPLPVRAPTPRRP